MRSTHPAESGPPLLIHYHIFKNAGTSFEWALEHAFSDGFARLDSSSPSGFVSRGDLADHALAQPHVRVISSHQAAPPAPAIAGREVVSSILIRDPIARIRSIYSFERAQQAFTPGAVKAKELGFKDYVDWRLKNSPAVFCNYQVHFCTRTEARRTRAVGTDELREAIAHLDRISIVGTVARYDEWIRLAQTVLSRSFPNISLESTHQNVTAADRPSESAILDRLVEDLGESTVAHLLEANQLDMCLHQVADSILTRKMAEEGVELALALLYSQALQNRSSSGAQPPSDRT